MLFKHNHKCTRSIAKTASKVHVYSNTSTACIGIANTNAHCSVE